MKCLGNIYSTWILGPSPPPQNRIGMIHIIKTIKEDSSRYWLEKKGLLHKKSWLCKQDDLSKHKYDVDRFQILSSFGTQGLKRTVIESYQSGEVSGFFPFCVSSNVIEGSWNTKISVVGGWQLVQHCDMFEVVLLPVRVSISVVFTQNELFPTVDITQNLT